MHVFLHDILFIRFRSLTDTGDILFQETLQGENQVHNHQPDPGEASLLVVMTVIQTQTGTAILALQQADNRIHGGVLTLATRTLSVK